LTLPYIIVYNDDVPLGGLTEVVALAISTVCDILLGLSLRNTRI